MDMQPEKNLHIIPLSRRQGAIGYHTDFDFDPPLRIDTKSFDTLALNAFELHDKYKIICKIFCLLDKIGYMSIKVEVESKLECEILKVVLVDEQPEPLIFHKFKMISMDPNVYLSERICGPSKMDRFKSGYVVYDIKHNEFVGRAVLKNSLEMGEYYDLTIKLDNGKEFKVHKMVLAFRSQVFKKMIDSDMMENKTGIIHVGNVESDVMQEVLNFIYGLHCDLSKSPHSIFRIAHLYGLTELVKLCEKYMTFNISFENFFEIFSLVGAEVYELKQVADALAKFMKKNESGIVKNVDFIEHLINNMKCKSIHFLLRLCMQYDLDAKRKVIIFILENLKKVLQNPEFEKLILKNPQWSMEIFGVLSEKSNSESLQD